MSTKQGDVHVMCSEINVRMVWIVLLPGMNERTILTFISGQRDEWYQVPGTWYVPGMIASCKSQFYVVVGVVILLWSLSAIIPMLRIPGTYYCCTINSFDWAKCGYENNRVTAVSLPLLLTACSCAVSCARLTIRLFISTKAKAILPGMYPVCSHSSSSIISRTHK